VIKIQSLVYSILFAVFFAGISGCSGSDASIEPGPPSVQTSPQVDYKFGTVTVGNEASPLEVVITNNGT
jgi:hypothetical protein